MRTFTNKEGKVVELSDKHLARAIEIKLELQALTPKGRCKWPKLVSMMYAEGFTEAESSEQYRIAIKAEQKKQGLLPSSEAEDDKVEAEPDYKETIDILSDGSQKSDKLLELNKEQMKDPEYLLQAHGYDPKEWELVKAQNSMWNMYTKKSGKVVLYSSKVFVKPLVEEFTIKDFLEDLNKDVKTIEVFKNKSGLNNLVIPLADLHFPILTLDSAKTYLSELKEILSKGYNEIVIEMLGDTFHSNAMRTSQTIRGTMLEDVNMEQAIEEAKGFFDFVIVNAIANSKKVRIEYASGNHSDFEYMFCVYLEAKYPQIIVNKHLEPRKAFKIGNVGIMLTHGNFAKKKDYPMLFATEFQDIWSECDWKECHSGHYHTMESKNEFGIIHRQLGTLKPNDKYEEDNGFTMGYKTTQVFEYSEDKLKVIYDVG